MAIQTQSLSAVEHDWYATRSGATIMAPLTQHKASYYVSKGITQTGKPLSQMEREWLQTLTGVTSNRLPDMWREAVAGQGLTPSVKMPVNQFLFYSQVTTSP